MCRVLDIYDFHSIEDIKSVQLTLEVEKQFSSHWLLHQMIYHLDTYMMRKCVHIKFGIVLFWKGGDVLVALSWALHSLLNSFTPSREQISRAEKMLALITVNSLMHNEIKIYNHQLLVDY